MVNMENAEEVMQILERFTRLKQKEIPKELDEYLQYVAKTGDTVFKWSSLKYLFREKLLNVMKHFHDTTPHVVEIPQYPNVDPFNYESMKSSLLERLELFNAAPFTIQRLCELLIDPRKQYSRIDKFMRALEKNILVVSTVEPGRKRTESENGDSLDSVVNGDLSLDVNVDIDMENESLFHVEAQNGSGGDGETEALSASANTAASSATATVTAPINTEVKEKPTTESPNVSHTIDDDDILPNPKKPKLDLKLENNEGANSVGGASGSDKELQASVNTTEKDRSELMETPEIQEKSVVAKDPDSNEEEGENKENMVSCEKLKRKIPSTSDKIQPTKIDNEEEENSNALKKLKNKAKEIEESKDRKEETNNKDQEEKEEQEETEADAAIKTEEAKHKLIESAVEKIIEKQETEKDEKQQTPLTAATVTTSTPPRRENKKSEISPEKQDNLEKQSSSLPTSSSASTSAAQQNPNTEPEADEKDENIFKTSNEINQQPDETDVDKHQKPSTSSRESPSRAKCIETSEDKVVHTEAINTVINSDDKQMTHAISKSMKKSVEKNSAVEEEEKESTAPENSVKEEQDISEASIIQKSDTTTTTNLPNSDGEGSDSVVSFATDTSLQAVTATITTDSEENVGDTLVTPSSAIKFATVPSVIPIITPPIPTPPALALNDQPMDEQQTDVAIDNIAEVTELNNTADSTAVSITSLSSSSSSAVTVEEVIMSEINCASGGGSSGSSAMATDAIEPAKDEPSGMEVDDTSQEAMDQ